MKVFNGRRRAVAISLALLLFAFSPASVRAQDESATPQRETRQDRGRFPGLRQRLNLTPEQLEQIKAIREQNKEEWRTVRQRIHQAQRALDEAVYADQTDEAMVEARARDVGEAHAAMARMRALMELKIRRVLTPEQLNTLRTLRQQRATEREQRMRERGGRPHRRMRRGGL